MTRLKAIFGAAGVGKSFYLNSLIEQDLTYARRTATTGMAALSMGSIYGTEEPTTINRALHYSTTESLLSRYIQKKLYWCFKSINNRYKNIAIDEISMMNAATLDLIVKGLKDYNSETKSDLGLIISGDLAQLSPVEGRPIFQAQCWNEFTITNLTEVKRQDNVDFIKALHFIRNGNPAECLDWFRNNIQFLDEPDITFRGSSLFSINSEVDTFNRRRLQLLRGEAKTYTAVLEGTEHPTWKSIPRALKLKEGVVIQLLYNNFDYGFANGDLAIVEEMWENSIYISLLRKNRTFQLKPRKLEHYSLNAKGYLNRKPDGVLRLLHVKLAAASSIHKVQGLTLDSLQVNLKGPGKDFIKRQSGMLYTALSRVRSPEGLTIVGTPEDLIHCCYLDADYKQWII